MKEGVAQYKVYFKDVASVKAIKPLTARIEMKTPNREVLLALVQGMAVLRPIIGKIKTSSNHSIPRPWAAAL